MKKKILCGIFFLTILFCISFSQTHMTAAGAGFFSGCAFGTDPSLGNTSGMDSALGNSSGMDSSLENVSDVDPSSDHSTAGDFSLGNTPGIPGTDGTIPGAQSAIDAGGQRVPLGDLATPEPLENTAASAGEFTLSLTTSIGTLTYYNQSDSRWANYPYGGSDPLARGR